MSHKSRPFTVLGKVFFVCVRVCVTDERVLCAETVMNPLQMYVNDHSMSAADDGDQLRFLLTLRYPPNYI